MKIIIGAIALLIAAPAAAQTQAPDPHAGHSKEQHGQHQQGHEHHGQKGHDKTMQCCKDGKHGECCDKAKQQGQTMKCCEHKAGAKSADHSAH